MRTLQICDSIQPDSSECRRVLTISNGLAERGYRVTVASAARSIEEKEAVESLLDSRVEVTWHEPAFRFSNFSYTPNLYQTISGREYDLIHAHSYRHYGTYVASLLRKKKGVPLVMSPYGSTGYESTSLLKPLYWLQDAVTRKYPIKYPDRILAETRYERDQIIKFGGDPQKIDVVYRDVDTSHFSRRDTKVLDGSTVLFVGRITRIKGLDLLLRSFSRLKRDVDLVIVGPCEDEEYYKELRNLADRLQISSRVKFLGPVPHEMIPGYCSSAAVLVLPSIYENLGGIILEAQSCECPVVAADVGGINEVMVDGETGFLVKGRSEEELTLRLRVLLEDEELGRRMGRRGRDFVLDNFSVKSYMARILESYDRAVQRRVAE